jgi:hypothetical protein
MSSLAQLRDQLRNAKHIVHIAHTGKHPVSGKEDTMLFEMYKKKPELVRQAEENVAALESAIRAKESKPKPRKTRKAKKGGRSRRHRRRM